MTLNKNFVDDVYPKKMPLKQFLICILGSLDLLGKRKKKRFTKKFHMCQLAVGLHA